MVKVWKTGSPPTVAPDWDSPRIKTSLLHRPLFIKFSLLTTKQIKSPAAITLKGVTVLGLGWFSVLNGQMSWFFLLIFGIIQIPKRVIEVDQIKICSTKMTGKFSLFTQQKMTTRRFFRSWGRFGRRKESKRAPPFTCCAHWSKQWCQTYTLFVGGVERGVARKLVLFQRGG